MRMLCSMWHPSRRGVLSLRLQAMARLLHASEQTTKSIIDEIEETKVGAVEWSEDGQRVTVICRRIVRDWEAAEANKAEISGKRSAAARSRWKNCKAEAEQEECKSNASALQMECTPETRNQKVKRERAGAPAPDDVLADQAKTIVEAYPRREKTADALQVVLGHLRSGDSYAAMLTGTRAAAAVIRSMPSGHLNRYAPSALAFFVSRRWADDPETLRRQGNQNTGKTSLTDDEVKEMLGGRAATHDEVTF